MKGKKLQISYLQWYCSPACVKVGQSEKIHKDSDTIWIHELFDIFL